jgi:ribonucleoside-diphosphate reductase alpha chain
MHRDSVATSIDTELAPADVVSAAKGAWDDVVTFSDAWGVKNAQASVLAPTGTIAFMMDCDTTGVEPDIALVKYKKLVGGGLLKIVNHKVPEALTKLGYAAAEVQPILDHIEATGTIEGAPGFKDEDLPVFDCAFKPAEGSRVVRPMGHVRMVAAVSPFISGSISKTINVPHEFTVEQVEDIYVQSWKLGLKCISLYRDGCKRVQPLNTSMAAHSSTTAQQPAAAPTGPVRRRLPDERASITHKFSVGGHEGYITVGMYEDGTPGEIFCTMAKQGSVVSGLMDTVATATSISLQYGVPIDVLVKKFGHTRFEPAGLTGNPEIPIAKSVIDYVFRWLGNKFIGAERSALAAATATVPSVHQVATGELSDTEEEALASAAVRTTEKQVFEAQSDAPPCPDCGSMMLRSGTCYRCLNCGAQNGCS